MVKIWGRLARTQRAVTAVCGDGDYSVATLAFSDFCGPRGRSFDDQAGGENGREWTVIRPQGGSNRGPPGGGADMARGKGLLGVPLVSTWRAADHPDDCQRRVE